MPEIEAVGLMKPECSRPKKLGQRSSKPAVAVGQLAGQEKSWGRLTSPLVATQQARFLAQGWSSIGRSGGRHNGGVRPAGKLGVKNSAAVKPVTAFGETWFRWQAASWRRFAARVGSGCQSAVSRVRRASETRGHDRKVGQAAASGRWW